MNAHLILAVLAVLAARVGFLYVFPFGPCPKCKGTGHIKRGPRRRPVCPRCKGRRRIQRRGSRTIHRLAFRIRHGQRTAARYQQEDKPWEELGRQPVTVAAAAWAWPCWWSWAPRSP